MANGAFGAGLIQPQAGLSSAFRRTAAGTWRVNSVVPAIHPSSGRLIFFRHVGEMLLARGDLRIMKNTQKLLGKPVTRRGCRRK